ncbi:hypothetical protein QOZ80_6AG0512580 [Eleusine coracana subsp. coracana]|nr:hypothetical protein QOZ80_6AG0512580 [Eleusine coracana subsp. coracana]
MASHTIILFGFAAVFSCLQLLEATTKTHASHSRFAWLMEVAFVLAILTAFGLTLLLLFSHVRALCANAAGGDDGRRFVLKRLAKATLLMAMTTLLAGAVVQLVASGFLGADDVGWVHTKK